MTRREGRYDPMPVLLASKSGHIWRVWCPYCRKEHQHGAAPGLRAAHCLAGPFMDRGYIIALPGSAYLRRLQSKRPVLATDSAVELADGTVLDQVGTKPTSRTTRKSNGR